MGYLLECMLVVMFCDSQYVLSSTGQVMTGKDMAVGLLGDFAIVCLIVGIGNLIAFLKYNKSTDGWYVGIKKMSKKYFFIISIVFFALFLISIISNIFVGCFA